MDVFKIVTASVTGVSVMTAFSYWLSHVALQKFKEPQLLNYLLNRWHLQLFQPRERLAGWLIHYAIGIIFVIAYDLIWRFTEARVSWLNAIVFGLFSGVVGATVWALLFRTAPPPPKVNFTSYYLQLLPAHVLFALGVVLIYKIW